jgi:RNA polymerase sigma factor (sigma-70 family)
MTDEQLAEIAAAGDQEAFDRLYRRYSQNLFNFALRVVGESGLAEDAAQEALISAFQHIKRFDPAKGSFKAWIFTIARNQSRHGFRLRQWWPHGEKSREAVAAENVTVPDSWPSLDTKLDMEMALQRLSVKYRIPLILVKLHGLSIQECAEVLRLSEVNVKQRVFRAIHQLQEIMLSGNNPKQERG